MRGGGAAARRPGGPTAALPGPAAPPLAPSAGRRGPRRRPDDDRAAGPVGPPATPARPPAEFGLRVLLSVTASRARPDPVRWKSSPGSHLQNFTRTSALCVPPPFSTHTRFPALRSEPARPNYSRENDLQFWRQCWTPVRMLMVFIACCCFIPTSLVPSSIIFWRI